MLLLFPIVCLAWEITFSTADETVIRTAIDEQAKRDSMGDRGLVWSEIPPLRYSVRRIQALSIDVAIVDVDGFRTDATLRKRSLVFVVTRSNDHWTVIRKIVVATESSEQ